MCFCDCFDIERYFIDIIYKILLFVKIQQEYVLL